MKLSKKVVQEREDFLVSFFKTNPTATKDQANEALVAKDGKTMRAQRIYQLRKIARAQLQSVGE